MTLIVMFGGRIGQDGENGVAKIASTNLVPTAAKVSAVVVDAEDVPSVVNET